MARTNVPLTKLTANSGNVAPSTTNLDATNSHNIALASGSVPAQSGADRLVLVVNNTFAGSKTITVKAGANPPAQRAGLGDLVVTLTQNQTAYIGPLEPARFLQTDGSINVDVAASMTGTILAVLLPRAV